MKIIFILCQIIATAVALQAAEPTASKLLDRVISHPGCYFQVYNAITTTEDVPYRALELTNFAGASFSKANIIQIKKNRNLLIKALRTRLLAIDFTRKEQPPTKDLKPEENFDGDAYGSDPKLLNPLLLELISQLHAIAALPELLIVEQQLMLGIAKTQANAEASPPAVAGWFVSSTRDLDENETTAARDHRTKLFHARVAQRDLVILMARLLRENKSPAYLKTSLEAAYAKGLKKHAASYPPHLVGEPIPLGKHGIEYTIDPITNALRVPGVFITIPYTRESRDEIRTAAIQWITQHP